MFISSKKNFLVRLDDGSTYRIRRDYIGNIPDKVAESYLVQMAIKGGDIVTPESHSDKAIETAMNAPVGVTDGAEPETPKKSRGGRKKA